MHCNLFSVVHQKNATFPVFTICPNNGAYKNEALKKHGYEKSEDYNCGSGGIKKNKNCPFWTS